MVAAAAKMAIGRWAIWGFRVSDVRAGLVDLFFHLLVGGCVRACVRMRRASRSVHPHPASARCCAQTACAVQQSSQAVYPFISAL